MISPPASAVTNSSSSSIPSTSTRSLRSLPAGFGPVYRNPSPCPTTRIIAHRSASGSRSFPTTAATRPRCSPRPTPRCMRTNWPTVHDDQRRDAVTYAFPHPIRLFAIALLAALLAACQSAPAASGFSAAQIATLRSEGFVDTGLGWELNMPERLLFPSAQSSIPVDQQRSEEHTSELQSLMRTSSPVFCFKKNKQNERN